MTNTAAIVTTLKHPGEPLGSFLTYHFSIGFDRIFLFFDDEFDPMIPLAASFPGVTVIKNDASLKAEWKKTRIYSRNADVTSFIDEEVMARQLLNVEVAVKLAHDFKIDWLLHIDHDELFFTKSGNVKEHFQVLSASGIKSMQYLNHESIPEKVTINDPFKEVTLFKKNPMILSKNEIGYLEKLSDQRHFLYYWNGKSSGKVSEDPEPEHVHGFKYHQAHHVTSDPCILHYPVCGLTNFIEKYKILGKFKDKWFDSGVIKDLIPFHIEARDIISTEDDVKIKNFYLNRIMANKERVKYGLSNGIYFRELVPWEIVA